MLKLEVYVSKDCWSCAESRRIVEDIAPLYPKVVVELLDVDSAERPEAVFAVPTFVLDGQIISLGNPYRAELRKKIEKALEYHNM